MAIGIAADKAGIKENFRVEEIMGEMDPFMALLQSMGTQARSIMLDSELNEVCSDYQTLKSDMLRSGVQMYCPYRIHL